MSLLAQYTQPPPSYNSSIRTVYDETHRGIWHSTLVVASMGNNPNLLGHLEHYEPTTDGSFSICCAGGEGVFISQALYESIPLQHRPTLDTSETGRDVELILIGAKMATLGSTYFPFILTTDTNEKVRMVLRVYVVKNLLVGMFWGMHGPFARGVDCSTQYSRDGPTFTFAFKNGQTCRFHGI
ncbi:hypothetical protein BDZ97DRAFT_1661231 [Flammula alnicola]|nr:hypothetical protein BDZ97DRAFT_1661231 [Flammula alnicola]